jgi:hypothetical protein
LRQLILIDDTVVLGADVLAEHLSRAPLGDAPVIALDTDDWVIPEDGPAALRLREADSRPWIEVDIEEYRVSDGRKVIVANHHDGGLPRTIDRRTRSLFTHCDTLVARCPRHQFLAIARFYEPSLFALTGELRAANVTAAVGYLNGLVDRLRANTADRRHRRPEDDRTRDVVIPADETVLSSDGLGDEGAIEEIILFETRPGLFAEDAARIGLDFIAEKTRFVGHEVELLAGQSGIAMFGPYIRLDAGHYRLQLSVDAGSAAGLRFTLEAVWGGGANNLGAFACDAGEASGRVRAVLTFEVDGPAVQQPLEFRLWTAEGAPAMRLRSARLGRVLA